MESKGIKIIEIKVNIDDLVEKLRTQFSVYNKNDDRQIVAPKKSWIINAMKMFVKLKYAKKDKDEIDNYIVRFKNLTYPLRKLVQEIYELKKPSTLDKFLEG